MKYLHRSGSRGRARSLAVFVGFVLLLSMVLAPTAFAQETLGEATETQEEPAAEAAQEPAEEPPAEQPPAEEPAEEPVEEPATEPTADPSPASDTGTEQTEGTDETSSTEGDATAAAATEEASTERAAEQQVSPQQVGTQSHGGSHRGTVKVDGVPINQLPPNEPHDACPLAVQFFGFRAGVPATATMFAHPPSGSGQVVASGSTTLQNDPAGGGTDFDGNIILTVTEADVAGLFEHPQQGYHVRLVAIAGGVRKQKTIWLRPCPAPPGRIVVTKLATPDTSTLFNFRGTFGPFRLGDDGSRAFGALPAGTYVVHEAAIPAGWAFRSLSCTDPTGNTSLSGRSATIRLAAGETVRCTWANELIPVVVVPRQPRLDLGPPLAVTGFSTVPWLILGLSLIAAGTGSTILGRRRDDEELEDPAATDPAMDAMPSAVETAPTFAWEDASTPADRRRSLVKPAVIAGVAIVGVAAAWWLWKRNRD